MKIFFLVIPFILFSCVTTNNFAGSSKFEAALNMKIKEAQKKGDTSEIGVIIKLKSKPSNEQIDSLKNAGINVNTIVGNIITAEGKPEEIIDIAKFEFVEFVQLAKNNNLLKTN